MNYFSGRKKWFFMAGFILLLAPIYSNGQLSRRQNRAGIVYWHGDATQKRVALTFDDGPNEPYTSQILKILKDNDVRATFFLIGQNVDAQPETARAIADAGHVIGNHSYDHGNLVFRTAKRARQEVLKAEEAIFRATNQRPILFRPPFGGDNPLTFRATEKLGYVVVKWTISPRDWQRPGAEKILERVMTRVDNGYIVLLHDGFKTIQGADRSQTVAALPMMIKELRAQGYEFVTVPELLGLNEPQTDQRLAQLPPQ